MDNNKLSGIVGAVAGKSAHGIKLKLASGAEEWFNYGKNTEAAVAYKAVTKDLRLGDIVTVDAVVTKKNDKNSYYLRSVNPGKDTSMSNEAGVAVNSSEASPPGDIGQLIGDVLSAIQRIEVKQENLEGEFADLKENIRNLAGGLGQLTPSEKAKTCHVLAVNLVENAFTNGDIGQKLGNTLEDFSANLKGKILPLIRDIAESIGDDLNNYEEKLTNNSNSFQERPSL